MRALLRVLIPSVLLICLLLAAGPLVQYDGTWTSKTSGSGGKLQMVLSGPEAASESKFSFTINGETVPCKTKSMKWNGDAFEGSYGFEVQGAQLESSMKGKRDGDKIEGSYKTRTDDGSEVDEGTFSASVAK